MRIFCILLAASGKKDFQFYWTRVSNINYVVQSNSSIGLYQRLIHDVSKERGLYMCITIFKYYKKY